MTTHRWTFLAVLAAAVLAGCSSSGSDSGPGEPQGQPPLMRAFHAVSDVGTISFIDEQPDQIVVWTQVEYGATTGWAQLPAEEFQFHFDILPAGADAEECSHENDDDDTCERLGSVSADVAEGREYTAVVHGTYGDTDVTLFEKELHLFEDEDSDMEVQVFHLTQNLGEVDVYLTAPGAALSPVDALTTLSFGGNHHELVEEGEYELTVTAAADPSTVLFASPPFALEPRTRMALAVVDSAGTSTSDFQVRLFGNRVGVLEDAGSQALLRVVHSSRAGDSVDVFAGGDLTTPLVADLSFHEASERQPVDSGDFFLNITPAGNPGALIGQREISVAAAEFGTFYLTGASATSLGGIKVRDDLRRLATHARMRMVNTASSHAELQFFVVLPGTDLDDEDPRASLSYPGSSTMQRFDPGTYDVVVVNRDSEEIVTGPQTIEITAGGIFGIVATDAADPLAVELLLIDDFDAD